MTNLNEEERNELTPATPEAVEQQPPAEQQPQAERTFTQAELDEILKTRLARAKKDVPEDYEELKQKAAQLEATERERREAEMSEIERYQAQLAEKDEAAKSAAQQLAEYKAQVEREKIQNAFTNAAVGADVAYLDDALRLADLSGAKIEDGKVVGVDEIVADLVKSKPFLLRATPTPIGNATQHQEPKAEKTAEQQLEQLKEAYKKSGKAEDMAHYISFKREAGL